MPLISVDVNVVSLAILFMPAEEAIKVWAKNCFSLGEIFIISS